MLARFGFLEWAFAVALIVLVAAAVVFGMYVVLQLFRTPGPRRSDAGLPRP
jgi:L-asparagine transporter-like permease